MLISQIEHARLSYELATGWGAAGVQPLMPREPLLAAVLHHDDGWAEWERMPDVDPESGRPLSFLEMPIDAGVVIWRRSIDIAAELGPLAAYIVAGHFAALVRRAREVHIANPHWLQLVAQFLERQIGDRDRWLAQWQAGPTKNEGPPRTRELADRGLAQLQMFDALSLWFCMAERTEPLVFPTPDGPELTWTPVAADAVTVDPWPWFRDDIRVTVSGRLVPVDHYGSRHDLAQAPSETGQLSWTIRPAGSC